MARIALEPSSGNVFADLGIPEADDHKLKAGLVSKLASIMQEQGLNANSCSGDDRHRSAGPLACASWSVPRL